MYILISIYVLQEGNAYIKRTAGNKKKGQNTTGRKRTGGRVQKGAK